MPFADRIVDKIGTPRGMLLLVAVAWVASGAAIVGTSLALRGVSTQADTTSSIVDRLKRAESEASVTRVLSADQRCAFSAKSAAAHAATVGELRAIVAFVDDMGVPRSATQAIRRGAAEKAQRVRALQHDVEDCVRTRNGYFRSLNAAERASYASKRVEQLAP